MAAAVKTRAGDQLRPGDRVILRENLLRVPEGTPGKVTLVNGLKWIRYWVAFDDGERVGLLDRSKLATPEEWERRFDAPVASPGGAVAVGTTGAGADAAGSGGGATNPFGVPDHLIERSRIGRQRWAEKHG